MTKFEEINAPRVAKILKMLDVIQTSARSNKLTETEISNFLRPVYNGICDAVYDDTHVDDEPVRNTTMRPAPPEGSHDIWNSIRDMCETAPLADLTVGMAVYLDRIGEKLKDTS